MAIHLPQLSFVTEILDFVSLIFAHIIAAIFVELGGGGVACIFERFDVIVCYKAESFIFKSALHIFS